MADPPESTIAARQTPRLDAIATDEERRNKAKRDLVRALQSCIGQFDNPVGRLLGDATRLIEIFCAYARENYASRAAKYFEGTPTVDLGVLFEPGDLTETRELCGLPTIGDVFALAKGGVRVEGLKFENGSLGWLLLEEPWGNQFRSQIRDCVNGCVRAMRNEYELGLQPRRIEGGTPIPPAAKVDTTRRRLGARLKKLKAESKLPWKTIVTESGVSYRWLLDIQSGRTPSTGMRKTIRDYFSRVLERPIRF